MVKTNRQKKPPTDGHGNSMTELAQWGQFRAKLEKLNGVGPVDKKPSTIWLLYFVHFF